MSFLDTSAISSIGVPRQSSGLHTSSHANRASPSSSVSSTFSVSKASVDAQGEQPPQQPPASTHDVVSSSKIVERTSPAVHSTEQQQQRTLTSSYVYVSGFQEKESETTRHGTSTASTPAAATVSEVQMVADLKSELFHVSRQLAQARQLARTSEETCTELRQRNQTLEVEKQTLGMELQDAQDRLQVRQTRLDEHRRDAADAKLAVVSLTAERDELSLKVQEAWHIVAELRAALLAQKAELARLQEEKTQACHAAELATQQRSTLESQLRTLQEQLRVHGVDTQSHEVARERLSAALNTAVQRLAGLLSDVAYDYQESVAADVDGALREQRPFKPSRITASDGGGQRRSPSPLQERSDEGEGEEAEVRSRNDPPHVVLSPAYHRPSPSTASLRSPSVSGARLHGVEQMLYNAESFVLGQPWDLPPVEPAAPLSATQAEKDEREEEERKEVATAATPPARTSPSSSPAELVQRRQPSTSDDAAVSEQLFLRTALTPLLLAMKHVSAMLSTVRHEHQRAVAEAAHYKSSYHNAQSQLEALQGRQQAQEAAMSASREQSRSLEQRAENAENALRQRSLEDTERRAVLARLLNCREEWALIQHSVERLLVQHEELRRDMAQLRTLQTSGQQRVAVSEETHHQDLYCQQQEQAQHRWREDHSVPKAEDSGERFQHVDTHQLREEAVCSVPATEKISAAGEALSEPTSEVYAQPSMPVRQPPFSLSVNSASPLPPAALVGDRATVDSRVVSESAAVSANSYVATLAGKAGDLPAQRTPTHASPSYSPSTVHVEAATARQPSISPVPSSPTPLAAQGAANLAPPVSRRYPIPIADTYANFSPAAPAHSQAPPFTTPTSAERELLHSLYGGAGARTPLRDETRPPPPPLPQPGRSSPTAHLSTVLSGSSGADDEHSSMFAAEVLQVIEALDRRVSGALKRPPR